MNPKAEIALFGKIKIKTKARILEGRAIFQVKNPWAKVNFSTNLKGNMDMEVARDIKALKLKTALHYKMSEGHWSVAIDRSLTQNLRARISSSQSDKNLAFGKNSKQNFELTFGKSF